MNVATQKWVRVFDQQNRLVELSLVDVLVWAHQLKTVHGSTPLERVSLFRVILALLYRTCQPETEAEAERIWKAGQFEAKRIKNYLAVQRDRFNLFDEEHPFYQMPNLPENLKNGNINRLFLNYSTGTKGTAHSHIHDGTEMNLTPAQAARAVVTAQCFQTAGGKSGRPKQNFRHTGPLRQANFILEGQSLFETLWLHLFPKNGEAVLSPFFPGVTPTAEDRPVWERDDPEVPERHQPQGPLDALTYPCRLIKLVPEPNKKRVNQVIISQSLWIKEDVPLFDPMVAYRLVPGKNGGQSRVYPVRIEQGFLNALDLFDPEEENQALPVYARWRRLVQDGCLDPNRTLFTAVGVECDKDFAASTRQIYNYHLPFPSEILVDQERFSRVKRFSQEARLWSRLGVKALETGIQALPKLIRKRYRWLPCQLREQMHHLTEDRLPFVIGGQETPAWEKMVGEIFSQQASLLPLPANVMAQYKFNGLKKAWRRKLEQDNRSERNE